MKKVFYWTLKIFASFILLQTLYFKFTAAPESVYIFSTIGMEPWGRIGSGIIELVAGVLLLTRGLDWLGAILAAGTMMGAIVFHLTILGIEVKDDKGQLFSMALIVLIISIWIIWNKRRSIPFIKNIFN